MTASAADFWTDPYPLYHELRSQGRVHWSDEVGAWLITGFEAARQALVADELSSDWLRSGSFGKLDLPVANHVREWTMWADPPRHTDERGSVAGLFTTRAVAAQGEDVASSVRVLLERYRAVGGDAITEFVRPLIASVMAAVIGMPEASAAAMCRWSDAAAALMANPRRRSVLSEATSSLGQLESALSTGQPPPANSVLHRLAGHSPAAGPGTLFHFVSLMSFAGVETTSQALARLFALDADGVLRRSDSPVADVVDELLRYDTPVPQVPRVATAPVEITGAHIKPGDSVVVILAAANRDPAVFADPDTFDPTRSARHLSFGLGRHRCLGAPLAELLVRTTAIALLEGPAPKRMGATSWHRSTGYRGIAHLPLAWDMERKA